MPASLSPKHQSLEESAERPALLCPLCPALIGSIDDNDNLFSFFCNLKFLAYFFFNPAVGTQSRNFLIERRFAHLQLFQICLTLPFSNPGLTFLHKDPPDA